MLRPAGSREVRDQPDAFRVEGADFDQQGVRTLLTHVGTELAGVGAPGDQREMFIRGAGSLQQVRQGDAQGRHAQFAHHRHGPYPIHLAGPLTQFRERQVSDGADAGAQVGQAFEQRQFFHVLGAIGSPPVRRSFGNHRLVPAFPHAQQVGAEARHAGDGADTVSLVGFALLAHGD